MSDNLKPLLEEVGITEETYGKIQALVEANIHQRLEEKEQEFLTEKEQLKRIHEEELAEQREAVVSKVDDYVNHVVSSFLEEEKQAIIETEEYSRMKGVFSEVKEVFERYGFDISSELQLEEIQKEKVELSDMVSSLMEENLTLRKELKAAQKTLALDIVSEKFDLTDLEEERLVKITEDIDLPSDVESIVDRLSDFADVVKTGKANIKEEVEEQPEPLTESSDAMSKYLSAL